MIEITQQRNKCIGCNACVEAAPVRWQMSRRDGKSVLLTGKLKRNIYTAVVSNDEYEANLKAAANCPVKIIHVKRL